ncbi:MAG: FtsH protease activity modulator HflK, partial [Gammaproteobacteria bacterium]
ARLREEANAYKASIVSRAEGDASRFEQLLTEYEKAPEITRQRLYLESMEAVMTNTSKVLLDAPGTNNLMYIPIDKLFEQRLQPQAAEGSRENRTETPQVESSDETGGSPAGGRVRIVR